MDQFYFEQGYLEARYFGYVASAEIGSRYILEGYLPNDYFEYRGSLASLSCDFDVVIIGTTIEAQGFWSSEFTSETAAVKNVSAVGALSAEFTQTTLGFRGQDIDLFAFTEAAIQAQVDRIRDNNIDATAFFSVSTEVSRIRALDTDAFGGFTFIGNVERSRVFDIQTQAAFSFDVTAEASKEFAATLASETTQTTQEDLFKEFNITAGSEFAQTTQEDLFKGFDIAVSSETALATDFRVVRDAHLTAFDSVTITCDAVKSVETEGTFSSNISLYANGGFLLESTASQAVYSSVFVSRNVGKNTQRPHQLVDNFINGTPTFDTNIKKFGTSSLAPSNNGSPIIHNFSDIVPTTYEDFYVDLWYYHSEQAANLLSTGLWINIRTLSSNRLRIQFQVPLSTFTYPTYGYVYTSNIDFLTVGAWHHIAVVKTTTELSYYVNGNRVFYTFNDVIPSFSGRNYWGSAASGSTYDPITSIAVNPGQGRIDEIYYARNTTLGISPSSTTITVPTTSRENADNVGFLYHFDGDVFDDVSIRHSASANLVSSFQRTIKARADFDCQVSLNPQFTINAIIGKVDEINLAAFSEGAVSAIVERIQQGESQLAVETLVFIDYFNLTKPGNFNGNITSSLSLDISRIRNITIGYIGDRTPKTVTAFGNLEISTAQSKFGAASALITDTGDYFTVSGDSTLYNGNFTVELFLWGSNLTQTPNGTIWDNRTSSANGMYLYVSYGSIGLYEGITGKGLTNAGFNNSQWNHIAVVRNGTNIKVFVNGVQKISATVTTTNYSNRTTYIGTAYNGLVPMRGYYDEVRLSSSVRYTTGFTTPTTAFTSDSDVRALLHLDTNFSDDTAAVLGPEIVSTVSADISKVGNTTISLNLQSQLTAIIGTLETINFVAFNNARVEISVRKFVGYESLIQSQADITASLSYIFSVAADILSSVSVAADNSRIRDVEIATDSIATALTLGDLFESTAVSIVSAFSVDKTYYENGYITEGYYQRLSIDANIVASGSSDISSEFQLSASIRTDVFVDIAVESTASIDATVVKTTENTVLQVAAATLTADVAKSVEAQADISSEFTVVCNAVTGSEINATLFNEATLNAVAEATKPFAASLDSEFTQNTNTADSLNGSLESYQSSEFSQTTDGNAVRGAVVVTESIATQLSVAVKDVVSDVLCEARFDVVIDGAKVTDITSNNDAALEVSISAVKTTESLINAASETAVYADVDVVKDAVIETQSIATQLSVVAKVGAFFINADIQAQVTADVSVQRSADINVASEFTQSTFGGAVRYADSQVEITASQTALVGVVKPFEVIVSSAMAFVALVREISIDVIVYVIPGEGWTYTIQGESREYDITGETNLRKITAESRLRKVNGESRIHIIE